MPYFSLLFLPQTDRKLPRKISYFVCPCKLPCEHYELYLLQCFVYFPALTVYFTSMSTCTHGSLGLERFIKTFSDVITINSIKSYLGTYIRANSMTTSFKSSGTKFKKPFEVEVKRKNMYLSKKSKILLL